MSAAVGDLVPSVRLGRAAVLVVAASASGSIAQAQSLAERVAAVRDGEVRLSFAARPEVCGAGVQFRSGQRWDDCHCLGGLAFVQVALSLEGGRVASVRSSVGDGWPTETRRGADLGIVPATEAAAYLLEVAPLVDGPSGSAAIFAAAVADSAVVWPRLLAIARDRALPSPTRRTAVFWLGQAAGAAAAEALAGLASVLEDDIAVKEHALFALSQLGQGAGIQGLIEIARSNRDPRLRRMAVFWLAQSEDPRALALFEELLAKR